ncbi:DUF4190 domain-containing protein [Glycomyces rhizosphaerae]|uniref:DUF4190 domain-containing protein n=1 Tax=Glycomyces rhizosphaerae TaxID=2054422 RepID=A0ABV7Q042_9ACTN
MTQDEARPASDPAPEPVPEPAVASDPVPGPSPEPGAEPNRLPDQAAGPASERSAGATADPVISPPPYDPYASPPPPYAPYGSPPPYYWQPPMPGTNGFAVAALVVGIVGLCFCFGFLGIIFGNVARRQIEATGQAGAGMATAGIVLGWIAVAWIVLRVLLVAGAGTVGY